MFTPRTLVIVVIAGIVGTIANAIVVSVFLGPPLMPLIFSFGRNAVAIIVALLLPVIWSRMSGAQAWAVALVALTVIPSILAKTVFGAGAPWGIVLAVNLVYAAAATGVWVVGLRLPRA